MNSKLQWLLSARRVPREYVPLDRVFIFLLITFFVKVRHARPYIFINFAFYDRRINSIVMRFTRGSTFCSPHRAITIDLPRNIKASMVYLLQRKLRYYHSTLRHGRILILVTRDRKMCKRDYNWFKEQRGKLMIAGINGQRVATGDVSKQHYALSVNNRKEFETSWKTTVHTTFYIWRLIMVFSHGSISYQIISFYS